MVACKDFTDDDMYFRDFASFKNSIIDSETNGYGTELSSIYDTIMNQERVEPS
ncbi:hypothetical protein M2150_001676 [Lachnospiraceae bacterium PM6-15]|uniref:hypothetical protein n=1 Tax=Ohessyouella blattaphilus TaxID=2949333 RepID=UPI003E278D07